MSVFTSPATVSVPWTPVFPDPFYVSVCSDGAPTSADSALAIKANSKLPGSLQVIPELPASGGVVHCMASHISGDVNGDGVVNCVDLDVVKASFGKKLGQPGFNPNADVNGDGVVNVLDLSIVARQVPAGTVCD